MGWVGVGMELHLESGEKKKLVSHVHENQQREYVCGGGDGGKGEGGGRKRRKNSETKKRTQFIPCCIQTKVPDLRREKGKRLQPPLHIP